MDLRDATRMILSEPAAHPEPRYGAAAFEETVTVLCREIDRQAPAPVRHG